MRRLVLAFCLLSPNLFATAILAQSADAPAAAETRGEALKLAREEKQKSVTPYEPNGLERGMKVAEDKLATLLAAPDGPFMKLGSLATGSGFAFGGGFRNRRLFDREGAASIWGAYSLKTYWAVEGRLEFPDLANGHLTINTYGRILDYPRQDFFGIGPDAQRLNHTSFDSKTGTWAAGLASSPHAASPAHTGHGSSSSCRSRSVRAGRRIRYRRRRS